MHHHLGRKYFGFRDYPLPRIVLLGMLSILVLSSCYPGSPEYANPNESSQAALQSEPGRLPTNLAARIDPLEVLDQPTIRFQRLGAKHGFEFSLIHDGIQDRRGFLWFASGDGLYKFDGYTVTVYQNDLDDPDSLSDNIVNTLIEDRQGYIWIGTRNGLNRYNPQHDSFAVYQNASAREGGYYGDSVNAIFEDRDGNIWVGTDEGLNLWDPENDRFRFFAPSEEANDPQNEIIALFQGDEDYLWIGARKGILRFDPQDGRFFEPPRLLDAAIGARTIAINVIAAMQDGEIWFGSDDGIFRMSADAQTLRHYEFTDEDFRRFSRTTLSHPTVTSLLQDQAGLIWIGTEGGLNLFDPRKENFIYFTHDPLDSQSLSSNTVYGLLQDSSGILWVLTDNGLSTTDLGWTRFKYLSRNSGNGVELVSSIINAVEEDQYGNIWVGTNNGLSYVDRRKGEVTHYRNMPNEGNSLSANTIQDILEDSAGEIWIATFDRGINRYIPETDQFQHFVHDAGDPDGLQSNRVYAVYETRDGTLWAGTHDGYVSRLDEQTSTFKNFKVYVPEKGEPDVSIRHIIEDRDGFLWLGTQFGLIRFNPESGDTERYQHSPDNPFSLSNDYVLSLHEDRLGNMWIGTYGGGLNKFDPQTGLFHHYLKKDGLPNDSIFGILEDVNGFLWVSTNKGISCFDPSAETFKNYTAEDGLQGNEFNEFAYAQGDDGEMFFGGPNGLTYFQPGEISDNPFIPPVVITNISQSGIPIESELAFGHEQGIRLRWPENNFEFEFAALNYRQAEKNQYAYRLEGFEKDWHYTGSRRTGIYTNLPGGEFTLRVIAANDDGIWNETGSVLSVSIIPPVWQTNWFRVVVLLVIASTIFAGYQWRLRSVQSRSRVLENLVSERTQEIEHRRKAAEGLRDVLMILNTEQPLTESLNIIAGQAVALTDAVQAAIVQFGDDDCLNLLANSSREPMELIHTNDNAHLPMDADWLKEIVGSGDCQQSALLQAAEHGLVKDYNHMISVPIISAGQLPGALLLFYSSRGTLTEEDTDLANSFAEQAALAFANADLRERVQKMAVAAERSRLARDLHDAVTQTLFSASLIAEAMPSIWESDPDEGRSLLQELRQLSRGALAEMRTLLMELRPSAVIESDLLDLIHQLTEAVTGRTGATVYEEFIYPFEVPSEVHLSLYRIIQETLNNVVKHSNANNVTIRLIGTRNEPLPNLAANKAQPEAIYRVELEICDDGRGFDPSHIPPDHMGLRIVRERSEAINASLDIQSQPGSGTRIYLVWEGEGVENGHKV